MRKPSTISAIAFFVLIVSCDSKNLKKQTTKQTDSTSKSDTFVKNQNDTLKIVDNEKPELVLIKYSDMLGQLDDGFVKAFQSCDNIGFCIFFLKFKNGKQNDTLRFAYNALIDKDSFKLKSLQIDGKGLNEIIISWTESGVHTAMGQISTYDKKSIEIWNLNTHKKIFSAKPYMRTYESHQYSDVDSNWKNIDTTIVDFCENCEYSYYLNINYNGQIMIENIDTNISNEPCENHKNCPKPDHQEGLYIFKDGQYILNKNLKRKLD